MTKFYKPVGDKCLWPIGSVFISTKSTNPGTYLGGTWKQLSGRFLLGSSTTYKLGATGGDIHHVHEYGVGWYAFYGAVTNVDGACLAVRDYPTESWSYGVSSNMKNSNVYNQGLNTAVVDCTTLSRYWASGHTSFAEHMPPYLVVTMWERTA